MVARSKPIPKKTLRLAQKLADQQWASLGEYVEAFEQVVDALRTGCINMTAGQMRGITASPGTNSFGIHHRICTVIFNHRALTASPIMDLWRATIAEGMHAIPDISDASKTTLLNVLDYCGKTFQTMSEIRNAMLHGTWNIGMNSIYSTIMPNYSQPLVKKIKVTKRGYSENSDIPKDQKGIEAQTIECKKMHSLVMGVYWCFQDHRYIPVRFQKQGEEWKFMPLTFDMVLPHPSLEKQPSQ